MNEFAVVPGEVGTRMFIIYILLMSMNRTFRGH